MATTKSKKASTKGTASKSKKSTSNGSGSKKSTSNTTTDLEEIKQWAEARDGKPSRVKGTESGKNNDGVLRINFPGYSGEDTLEEMTWDDWYKVFQENNLAFLYQEETAVGKESRFFKLVNNK